MSGLDAPTESDSERNGVFSYAGEYHAFAIGAGAGAVAALGTNPELAAAVVAVALGGSSVEAARNRLKGKKVVEEVSTEPWYSIGGVALGYAIGLSIGMLP